MMRFALGVALRGGKNVMLVRCQINFGPSSIGLLVWTQGIYFDMMNFATPDANGLSPLILIS